MHGLDALKRRQARLLAPGEEITDRPGVGRKSPVIDISGREEIRAFATRFAAQRAAGAQFRHMVSNIAVTITGNRAAASAYLLVLISKDSNHRSLPPGRYACELIKEDSGQWRFSRRTVFHDHHYTLDGIGR
jgi:hypothetical protein